MLKWQYTKVLAAEFHWQLMQFLLSVGERSWSIVSFQEDFVLTTFWPLHFVQICTNSVLLPNIVFYILHKW